MQGMDDSVGSRLREARTRKKLSVSQVEAATKIRGRYLQAIEDGDWEQLPGDVYARAFIRTYGSFLGLDGERLAEEHRRETGAARPGERLPRVEPRPRRAPRGSRGPQLPPRLIAAAVSALVVVALVVVGLSSGGGSSTGGGSPDARSRRETGKKAGRGEAKPLSRGHSLKLVAGGEVWVCLLGGGEKPLVKGAILLPGESEGPFRSGSFTMALGNGAVTLIVDGKKQNLPEPASPIGFAIDPQGAVRELHEGERPTCS